MDSCLVASIILGSGVKMVIFRCRPAERAAGAREGCQPTGGCIDRCHRGKVHPVLLAAGDAVSGSGGHASASAEHGTTGRHPECCPPGAGRSGRTGMVPRTIVLPSATGADWPWQHAGLLVITDCRSGKTRFRRYLPDRHSYKFRRRKTDSISTSTVFESLRHRCRLSNLVRLRCTSALE
jgi:hypothetical protein